MRDRHQESREVAAAYSFVALVLAIAVVACVIAAQGCAAKMDGSTAGANAVTAEEIEANGVRVGKALPGPIYDLPDTGEWSSLYCHDRMNRMWIIIRCGDSISVIPALDSDGNQIVTPQA